MSASTCAACGFANPAGALFCGSCGSALGRPCPSCGTVVSGELAFCTSCGAQLHAGEGLRAAEERKIVTVLFVDLVGFTARAEQLDPEDVSELQSPYYARVKGELENYGGTVEKYIGDAVMAIFGAPAAHEDDPARAVLAALSVRDAIGELNNEDPQLGLRIRVGVTTGEALVRLDARPERGEAMAAGDVVNTAARLQAGAPIDGILVDDPTRRASERLIEYRAADAVEAKGKAEPVSAWEAVNRIGRLGVDIAYAGRAPLVGRSKELAVLRDALARAERERLPQLVTLVGAPGIGKSRLVWELYRALQTDPDVLVAWRQGRSLPYGEGVAYWALGEITKAHAGVLESDDASAAESKLRAAVASALPDPAEAEWVERHLRPLAGLGGRRESGSEGRTEVFAAWRRFFEAIAEQRPLVLVFEDLHWADDGLLDFVDHMAAWAADVPLVIVCTTRPELLERRPGWGGGKRNATTISLAPLSEDETEALLASLLGSEPLGEARRQGILTRAGGNPLYAEEYVRMVAQVETGLPLPESVQGIIAARLDTLAPPEKVLVQSAAVVGKVFWIGAVAAIAEVDRHEVAERLSALERREFVRRERRSSIGDDTAYVFRHALVRDVAYGQIPRNRRAESHRRAAEWIESLTADRPEDLADMVAHHYSTALGLVRAAGRDDGELNESARLALRDAGDRAATLFAYESAARFYAEALDLWPEDDSEHADLLLRHGRALHPLGQGADVLAAAADELLDRGERARAAEAEALAGDVLFLQGRRAESLQHLEGAAALVSDEPPSETKAFVLADLARYLMVGDDAEAAIRIGSEALAMADELGLDDLRAHTLNTIGIGRVMTGDLDGLRDLERGIEISRGLGSFQLARGLNNLGSTLVALGDLEQAYELYAESSAVAQKIGWTGVLLWMVAEKGDEHYHRGEWNEALAIADDILTEGGAAAPHLREIDARIVRSFIRLGREDDAGALADSDAGLEFARSSPDPQTLFPALACRARVLVETGSPEAAGVLLDELTESWGASPTTFGSSWLGAAVPAFVGLRREADLLASMKHARLRTRWLESAEAITGGSFAEAAGTYAAIGSLPDEAWARLRAAEGLIGAGRNGEGTAELESALAFYRRVGATRYVREAEALLAPAR
jgi:class 3 adenylate cyclase/tetratricopeptide (TPR) repeat protein